MNPLPRALILARSTDDAERAARFVEGDADIEVGAGSASAARRGSGTAYGSVVVAGDLADDTWLSAACRRAATELGAGGRLLVVLPDTPQRSELPADVIEAWRVVGAVAEHATLAIVLTSTAEVDGALDTAESFGSWQVAAHFARSPELVGRLDLGTSPAAGADGVRPHVDAEVAERRQLDAYRYSALGRVTTWCRRVRRRLPK